MNNYKLPQPLTNEAKGDVNCETIADESSLFLKNKSSSSRALAAAPGLQQEFHLLALSSCKDILFMQKCKIPGKFEVYIQNPVSKPSPYIAFKVLSET